MTFVAFERDLQELLGHLYDPLFEPSELLYDVIGCNPKGGPEALQESVCQAIHELAPARDTPTTARIRRLYGVLLYRYIQNLTQEEAANRLGITPRYLRSEQREAIRLLASRLWWRRYTRPSPISQSARDLAELELPESQQITSRYAAWRAQIQQEMASLQKSAPGMVTDISRAFDDVTEIIGALASKRNVELRLAPVQPELTVAIHPSALRQVLLSAIAELLQYMSSGLITLQAMDETERVKIVAEAYPIAADGLPQVEFIQEVLATIEGQVTLQRKGQTVTISFDLPASGKITVLVIDDNVDLVHFYRRYTEGTHYEIVHTSEGKRAFELVEAVRPDVIVLDVMLPDIDGWYLLSQLYENPATKPIPVVVCSVVRERELALALGAALYVSKPILRQEFLEALHQAVTRGAARTRRSHKENGETS